MKIFECEYYEVTCPDGGGMGQDVVAAFTKFIDAQEVAADLSVSKKWPHSADRDPKRFVKYVFENVQEYRDAVDQEAIRKRALAKLTKEEREALGL